MEICELARDNLARMPFDWRRGSKYVESLASRECPHNPVCTLDILERRTREATKNLLPRVEKPRQYSFYR